MKYVVALTGSIGSGKSTVANAFSALGVPLVDADIIAREVVRLGSPTLHIIAQQFGTSVLNQDGSLNRSVLRERIFSNPEEKSWLDNLLHPLIKWKTEQQIHSAHASYILWVVPLLIENKLQNRANRILVVDTACEIQIMRTLRRDGGSRKQVENILAVQTPRQQSLAYADDIIDNNGRLEEIIDRVTVLHQRYLSLATSEIQ